MTILQMLETACSALQNSGVETARLDAELLLCSILRKDRAYLHAHSEDELSAEQEKKYLELIARRATHEPIAYILGKQEFYGRDFFVNKNVLVPRPESEALIELLNPRALKPGAVVADVGCGSGALGITAYLENPELQIHFLDIDAQVFEVVKQNAKTHKVKNQHYYQGDLLKACVASYDALLCNLPYVPDTYPVNKAARHEPALALFSGEDGLEHFRRLFAQLATGEYGAPIVCTESFPAQHKHLETTAKKAGWRLVASKDFAQRFEHVTALGQPRA